MESALRELDAQQATEVQAAREEQQSAAQCSDRAPLIPFQANLPRHRPRTPSYEQVMARPPLPSYDEVVGMAADEEEAEHGPSRSGLANPYSLQQLRDISAAVQMQPERPTVITDVLYKTGSYIALALEPHLALQHRDDWVRDWATDVGRQLGFDDAPEPDTVKQGTHAAPRNWRLRLRGRKPQGLTFGISSNAEYGVSQYAWAPGAEWLISRIQAQTTAVRPPSPPPEDEDAQPPAYAPRQEFVDQVCADLAWQVHEREVLSASGDTCRYSVPLLTQTCLLTSTFTSSGSTRNGSCSEATETADDRDLKIRQLSFTFCMSMGNAFQLPRGLVPRQGEPGGARVGRKPAIGSKAGQSIELSEALRRGKRGTGIAGTRHLDAGSLEPWATPPGVQNKHNGQSLAEPGGLAQGDGVMVLPRADRPRAPAPPHVWLHGPRDWVQVPCEGARQLRCAVVRLWGCDDDDFWMLCEGRALADDMKVPQSGSHVQVRLRGVGGMHPGFATPNEIEEALRSSQGAPSLRPMHTLNPASDEQTSTAKTESSANHPAKPCARRERPPRHSAERRSVMARAARLLWTSRVSPPSSAAVPETHRNASIHCHCYLRASLPDPSSLPNRLACLVPFRPLLLDQSDQNPTPTQSAHNLAQLVPPDQWAALHVHAHTRAHTHPHWKCD